MIVNPDVDVHAWTLNLQKKTQKHSEKRKKATTY